MRVFPLGMAITCRTAPPIILSPAERCTLDRWVRGRSIALRLVQRAQVIQMAADGTHKHPRVKSWLRRHPRFHLHFIPTSSSWLNMVERWFREIYTRGLMSCRLGHSRRRRPPPSM